MSGIAELIKSELQKKGLNQQELAERAGISQPALSKLMNKPDMVPELKTLGLLSVALNIPLRRLVEACGFPLEEPGAVQNVDERLKVVLSAVPELRDLFAQMIEDLTPEDRGAILAYLDSAKARRANR